MKITIDTEKKTAVVHGAATFTEIQEILKAVCPIEFARYLITCENVPFNGFTLGGSGITVGPKATITYANSSSKSAFTL